MLEDAFSSSIVLYIASRIARGDADLILIFAVV